MSCERKRKRHENDDPLQNSKRNSPIMPESALPPPQKVRIIDDIQQRPMALGQTWYLVDHEWFRRWHSACSGDMSKEGPVAESDLGPVATAPLLDDFGNLKSSLTEGIDVDYIHQDAWNHLTNWYGEPPDPIPRQTIARGVQKNQVQLELYPPRFRVTRLSNQDTEPPKTISLSTHDSVKTLSERLATAVNPSSSTPPPPYRIWKVAEDDFSLARLDKDEKNILQSSDVTLEEAGIQSHDAFAVEFKSEDDKWLVDLAASAPAPLFKSNESFFNRMSSFTSKSSSSLATTTATLTAKKLVKPGTLGLGNMGNTCFMNSAIQCLCHNQEIAEYFLSDVYEQELNPDNPLGMHGQIAQAFAALLNRIWSSTPQSNSYSSVNSYSPREFKSTLSRFAPQFSGYQQHDSQEFVAFLLDGLHEDLNRILKKPYVENPDWDEERQRKAQTDYAKEILEFARESWKGYKKRNDSVIVDLFQGQYQSTLICPECEKVSITFDPFMYLTLPLPVQKKWRHNIYYVPWDNDQPHLRIPIELPRADCSFREVKLLLGRWMGVDPDNLLTLEMFNHRFYKNLDDNVLCGDMSDSDVVVCFELPCDARQSRSYYLKKEKAKKARAKKVGQVSEGEVQKESGDVEGKQKGQHGQGAVEGEEEGEEEDSEPFIVPIYLCDAPPANSGSSSGFGYGRTGTFNSYNRGPTLFGYPGVAVVPREKSKDLERIYECVVDRMQRWTRNRRDLWTWEEGRGSKAGTSTVQVLGEDDEDEMEEIQINFQGNGYPSPLKPEMITEIKKRESEDGEVVAEQIPVQTQTPSRSPLNKKLGLEEGLEEGDIVDEKSLVMVEDDSGVIAVDDDDDDVLASAVPVKVGPKKDVFSLRLQRDHENYGTGGYYGSTANFQNWESRIEKPGEGGVLLQENDAFYCEFDENMKAYYFGEERGGGAYGGGSFSSGSGGKFEHALWDAEHFREFLHPEYQAATQAGDKKVARGISLDDCLSEFTKEEKLGEDDLWYCPRCKKHQQATKRFDLWKVPDVLVVHLKRFSNSRILRDKIDVFVDFPTDSLDLGGLVGERKVLRELVENGRLKEVLGENVEEGEEEELVKRSEEPLVYDLFGVDEHIGGLGGGHYRAYAYNHMDDTWYHFDDSFVTPSKAADSVNQNAYLLFYRRRSSTPLGGKSHELVEQAKLKSKIGQDDPTSSARSNTDIDAEGDDDLNIMNTKNPLPTPPNENLFDSSSERNFGWVTTTGIVDDGDQLPGYNESLSTPVDSDVLDLIEPKKLGPVDLQVWRSQMDSSEMRGANSPTSSVGVEPDTELEIGDEDDWSQNVSGSKSTRKMGPGSPISSDMEDLVPPSRSESIVTSDSGIDRD
ncbi:UCH-domain-containing protein [Dendrothele bispora CBS 962.96]|uniref:ubiquitinyl hydrolase 1 n=1 Tax=Dendrothele bispora (strain CBS 962.96) TaxID=1314807 RepID=A0A4S8MR57_DENBC|nr:UCH-domain-containing protein [Dendrothele bispora CBS 962.96]